MAEALYKATKYMNANDTMIAKTGRPSPKSREEVSSNKRQKRWQEIKTLVRENNKLHSPECPARLSLHVDKGRRGINLARQAEGRPKQKTQKQVLPFLPGPWARHLWMLWLQVANRNPH